MMPMYTVFTLDSIETVGTRNIVHLRGVNNLSIHLDVMVIQNIPHDRKSDANYSELGSKELGSLCHLDVCISSIRSFLPFAAALLLGFAGQLPL